MVSFLVPAFTGLGAPHWDSEARALLCGMSRGTNKSHIARAALESIAFQVSDVLTAMQSDIAHPLKNNYVWMVVQVKMIC